MDGQARLACLTLEDVDFIEGGCRHDGEASNRLGYLQEQAAVKIFKYRHACSQAQLLQNETAKTFAKIAVQVTKHAETP